MPTVIEIVREHLEKGGFGGLMEESINCGCKLDDLVPCSSDFSGCEPGYKHMDPRNRGRWAIWRQKKPPTAKQWSDDFETGN